MGKRAKRRAQRSVLHAHVDRICALCGCTLNRALFDHGHRVRLWSDVQVNAGKRPPDPSPSGLLATP